MRTSTTFQKSERVFKVWEYQVSLGQLLVRSPKAPATETSPELLTNLDLVFLGVEYMAVPRVFRGLELSSGTPDEIEDLEAFFGKVIDPTNLTLLVSEEKRFPIVASSFSLSENDWDIFESPLEFRSEYRLEP
jgi:hypothetical protein